MSPPTQSGLSRNGRAILACPALVFGMRCSRCSSLGKERVGYQERDPQKRKAYLRLRERYHRRGKAFVYVDESGFAPPGTRRYAYAPKGQRVSGLSSGQRRPRTSLLAARIGQPFAVPLLFAGTGHTSLFTAWLEKELCPLLYATQVVGMDTVPFHKSAKTQALITTTGATVLLLPPSSPDLNPIGHDFATRKCLREYNAQDSLDTIVKT
jgi:DDE superfamily endonuclease